MNLVVTDIHSSLKRKPALRLVPTKSLSREAWLAVRKKGIGSSDAAAACGLNPYKSALELWLEKTGRDGNLPKADPEDETHPTYWGTLLEPIVAMQYAQKTGNRIRRLNAVLQHPDPKLAWMLANIDREVVGNPEVQILECKTAGIHGAKRWQDGVPEDVIMQVQHQLAVTHKLAADVAVLIGGQRLEIHRIHRDEDLIGQLIEREQHFWRLVETDCPPPADGSDSADLALRSWYPIDSGECLDFSQDEKLSATFSALLNVRHCLGDLEQREALLKQSLQQAMGSASQAKFEAGTVFWKKSKDSVILDVPRLLKDQPDLLQHYPLTKTGSRRFVIA